ncbi:hypothetical protein IK110_04590 [Candidatus Saccharibacteria bacterium]|nr:hypothetical protein [Candidatus Saccharibacteria bacterium]
MSYRCTTLTISPEFFEKHSRCVTVEPDDSVFRGTISSGHPMDFSKNADNYRQKCACILLRDVNQFVSEDMQKFIEEQDLFAFAYLYNNENRSKHIRVIISNSKSLKMVWVRYGCSIWPYLELVDLNDKIVGLVDYVNSGLYASYLYGVAQLGDKCPCSHFDFVKAENRTEVRVVEYDRRNKKMIDCPDKQFELFDSAGLDALKKEFYLSISA